MDLDPKKVQILTEELNFLQNFKKLGPEVKKGDPHEKSMNSDLLLSILTRNNLIVCNWTDICSRVLKRTKTTVKGEEKSVIDFLIVCEELFAYMIEMKIDEE